MTPPRENIFTELKRFMRFGPPDEAALRRLHEVAVPHFRDIAELFYGRLLEHPDARAILGGPERVARLKCTLQEWMDLLLRGPWDEDYYQRRARIGRVHVEIGLAPRYMFAGMSLIRTELQRVGAEALPADEDVRLALGRILDLELAIMLETFGEAFVTKVQTLERQEKERLEHQLALSEARYEEIVEKGEALIVTASSDGKILLFNRRCEEMCGIDRAHAMGQSWLELFVPEQDRPALARLQADALAGARVGAYEGPIAASGRRVRWHFTTLPGPSKPVLCGIGIDVTEEHELAVRTRRAERLAALGTMAAGLAHEIRNPLNAAHLQLALAQRRLGRRDSADVEGAVAAAELAAAEMRRLAALVTEFLQFARPQPLRLSEVDMRATAGGVVTLFRPEAAIAGCALEVGDGVAVPASIDEERMKQVVLNLVKNAVEAAGRGGHVKVEVAAHDGEVVLDVTDDGPGLSLDAPIFEPFYTTKEDGTGLGLAIVHRIVSDHGGRVAVHSKPGNTVFTVALPASH